MDEIHSPWSLRDMSVGREDFSTKNGDGARDLCRTQHEPSEHFMVEMVKSKLPNGIFINSIKQMSDDVSV